MKATAYSGPCGHLIAAIVAKITSWFLPSYVHRPAFFRWRLAPPWTNLPKCETNRSVFKTMTFARQIPKTVHSWGHKNITTPLANTVTKIVSACYWAIFCRHTFILDTDSLPVDLLCRHTFILDTDPLPVDLLCRHTFILDTDPLLVVYWIQTLCLLIYYVAIHLYWIQTLCLLYNGYRPCACWFIMSPYI